MNPKKLWDSWKAARALQASLKLLPFAIAGGGMMGLKHVVETLFGLDEEQEPKR